MRSRLEAMVEEMFHHGIKLNEAVNELEKRFILAALDRSRGNRSMAARALGIHRNTLTHKIHQHRLTR